MPIDYTKRPAPEPPAGGGAAGAGSGAATAKVTLTKGAPAVSLTKRGSATGLLRVNLNWNARPAAAPTGFFKRSAAPTVDLDLGCLYEFSDGSKGVVQALGGAFTSSPASSGRPVIALDGDDRSGTVSGGENLTVDLSQLARIRRVLVFAYIYEGAPNWAAADGVVTLHPADGAPVAVPLDEHDPSSRMCAVALLENDGGDLLVRREVTYVRGSQRELDLAYGWGMSWSTGRK